MIDVDAAWQDYWASRSIADRNVLAEHFMPLVRYEVEGNFGLRIHRELQQDDLMVMGAFGLMDAIEKFDPARGIRFETYASNRIRGAIRDELRSDDWVPRRVRHQINRVNAEREVLRHRLSRDPTPRELAHVTGMSEVQLQCLEGQYEDDLLPRSIDVEFAALTTPDGDLMASVSYQVRFLADHDSEASRASLGEARQRLVEAAATLGPRDTVVFVLYYYEGLTVDEIAETLGVSASAAYKVHARVVATLRERLQDLVAV